MVTDPIANFLTNIRNAIQVKHSFVFTPYSKLKARMAAIFLDQGFINSFDVEKGQPSNLIKVGLKYHPETKKPALIKLTRVSKPGLRKYTKAADIPFVLNNLGIAILSTSKGIMTDKQARKENVGGEILCYIY